MAGYKIQLKDKNGNRQYPVSTVDVVVDADGVSVADLLDRKQPTLVSGVNIKTINGKTLLGEGDLVIEGGSSSGETAESDVICVVWDDDTSDIPSNKEAYQKLAESINTVGKPAAVMVCVESGYRWGIAKYYWKSNVGGDIELTTPVTESGLYCVFTLTSEGVCTASYKQADLGGGSGLKYFVERYVYAGDTEEERTYNLESLAMASDDVDILWAGIYNASVGDTAGSWYARREYDAFVAEAHAYIDSESGILVMEDTSFCRDLLYGSFDVGYDDEREWLVAFFKRDNWTYERAYYGAFPIISWSEESNTVLRAYYLANGLAIAYVSVNIETGEVSQPVVGQ